jgi:DNA polymerase
MPIFHPSYLLRNPSREQDSPKWHTWQDLKEVRRRLDGDAMT